LKVVITQSMLFPWVGLLEQMRLADVFVHYDDVQFSKGSFTNRVQVKTAIGSRWMTVPLQDLKLGNVIDQVRIAPKAEWRDAHLALLAQSFRGAPYAQDALELAREVYDKAHSSIGQLARSSMLALGRYFGLMEGKRFLDAKDLCIGGAGSSRVLDIVRAVGGTIYITGHGARNYLDHEQFDLAGIAVEYVDYCCHPYPQSHGPFTPYVSALDLVANCGLSGKDFFVSKTIPWREFLNGCK